MFNQNKIEEKWQQIWENNSLFQNSQNGIAADGKAVVDGDDIDIKEIERVKIIDRKNAMETLLYEKSTWLEGDQAAKVIKVILL